MPFTLEIPKFLSHLRVDKRGYPIPFFVSTVDGVPEFRLLSGQKQLECIERKICGICGKKLHEYCYFISGPMGLQNGVSTDPAMHLDCAEFTMKACPHLFLQNSERRETGEIYKEAKEKSVVPVMNKPAELFIIKTNKFKAIIVDGSRLIKYNAIASIKFHYQNGQLTKFEN